MATPSKIGLIFLLVIVSCVSATRVKPPCKRCPKPNQVWSSNGNHPCQNTCRYPTLEQYCDYSAGNYSGCICKDGFLKTDAGDCIDAELCLGCPEELNEEYSECNNHPCQNTCESPNFIQVCSYSEGCYPGCICRENYLRNDNGVCVYKDNCPPQTCQDPNEKYYGCKPCRYTCENPSFACAAVCIPGCECKEGYIRQSDLDSTCVPKESCECPNNEEFKSCGTACPVTCENKDNPPTGCTKNCVLGCFCKKGYVRDTKSGKCVLPKNCPAPKPPKCKKNEVWLKKCAKFQDTCQRSYNPELGFKPGCCCKNGYVREFTGGRCIPRKDCYKHSESCESDERWD